MLSEGLKRFVAEHAADDVKDLALQVRRYPDIDMQQAMRQITGRKIAKIKIPTWFQNPDIVYPIHLSMEQCSSEHTARYKAKLFGGKSMTDLTGGFGIDFSFLSRHFHTATYVEQQGELVAIAKHNFEALGYHNIHVINEDAVEYLREMEPVDFIYLDPARRSDVGRKTVRIEDCTPNILDIEDLLEQKAGRTMIKLSPMLDISLALNALRNISDVYIISHMNECKELLFVKSKEEKEAQLHCVNIGRDATDEFSFTLAEERNINLPYTDTLGKYLYEPNSSIIKSGAYKSTALHFGLDKLHVSSHLYTSGSYCEGFQGRKFEIVSVCTLNRKDVKANFGDVQQANVTTRNFPLSVAELRKKLKLKDGGDTYIFATTLANNQKVLILCHKL